MVDRQRRAKTSMPPPLLAPKVAESGARPPSMVTPEMLTTGHVEPGAQHVEDPVEAIAVEIVEAEPAPWMVTLLVTSRSPVCPAASPEPGIVREYVPAGTTIVLGPGVALDWMIASRSESGRGSRWHRSDRPWC